MNNQQLELYAAERTVGEGQRFLDRMHIQSYLDNLTSQDWWYANYPMVSWIECGDRGGLRDSCGGWIEGENGGYIEMSRNHFSERYVIHEVAHVCAAAAFRSKSHDPYFARIYLELVYRLMGTEAWMELKQAFDTHGICYDEREGR